MSGSGLVVVNLAFGRIQNLLRIISFSLNWLHQQPTAGAIEISRADSGTVLAKLRHLQAK